METILINIDSNYRNKSIFPLSSYFTYKCDGIIRNIKNIKISSIELPNSFYNITSTRNNNTFDLTLLQGVPGDSYTVLIPNGKYDNNLLVSTIQAILDNINIGSDGGASQLERYNFTISLNSYSQKITISNPSGTRTISGVPSLVGGANFTLTFPTQTNIYTYGIGSILGYSTNSYTSTNTYTSEYVINLYTDPYIYVRINDYGTIYNNVLDKRLLAKIILDGSNNTFIFDNRNFITKIYEFVQPVDIERMEIELLDREGKRLDLNGCEFSITLEFDLIENTGIYHKAEKGYLRKL